MPERRMPDGRADGFSLVEMLVTLAVLGLAVTLVFRSSGILQAGQRPVRLAGAITAEIDRLRAEALRSGGGERLAFDARGSRFVSSRRGAAPIAALLPVTIETGDGADAVPGEIRFLPDGSSTGGRIVIRDATAPLVLTVSALTGRVRRDGAR